MTADRAADLAEPLRDTPAPDVESRVEPIAAAGDLRASTRALRRERDAVLEAWLAAARVQPFHAEHPDLAVADHIPALLDAVVDLLERWAPAGATDEVPMEDEAVARAARAHAQVRFEQHLGPVAIATEFRLLRLEVSRALARGLDDDVPAGDVVAAIALANDALDGATMLALGSLTDRIETVREEFLASTLHDVRLPITVVEASVALAARWARRTPLDTDRLAETLDEALYATKEMSLIVDTLADASRVAMGALELDRAPVVLSDVVVEALVLVEPTNRARVSVGGLAEAVGEWDRLAVRRVISNLLSNALKYSPPDRGVRVTATATPTHAVVEIVDEGIGLLPEELALIFTRYARGEGARHFGQPGLGLGLYASQGLARAHGGRIVLESDGRDRGTRAILELPLAPSSGRR